jgi:membrane associated rhomboid family serine protease
MLLREYAFNPAYYSHAFLAARGLHPDWWQLVTAFITYQGVHANLLHLAITCLGVLFLGPVVAQRFGAVLFVIFFLACGVTGALARLALDWGQPSDVIGASGAAWGVMAAALRLMPGQIPWAMPGETPMAPLYARQVLIYGAFLAAFDLMETLSGFAAGVPGADAAWQVHLGGFVGGLLLAGVFDHLRPRPLAHSLSEG